MSFILNPNASPPTAPAGANTQIQFNSGGAFGASANFTYTVGTNLLQVGNITGNVSTLTIRGRANASAGGVVSLIGGDAGTILGGGAITLAGGASALGTGGGAVTANGGNNSSTGSGGSVALAAGTSTTGAPGNVTINAASSSAGGPAGSVTITAGNSSSAASVGGSVTIVTGASNLGVGGANGGNLTLRHANGLRYFRGVFNDALSAITVGFYEAAPVPRATTAGGSAVFVAGAGAAVQDVSTFDGYTLPQVVKALRDIGILT